MGIILNINTAFETAFITLSCNEEILREEQSNSQKNHAAFLEVAIKKVCDAAQINLTMIDAVSVINGPGSYTGLRVSLASAKALCYVLNKPLILLNTLDVMAYALKLQSSVEQGNILFCPLIDARRMEVYAALYDINLNLIKKYSTEIVDENFLENERDTKIIIAGGNGSLKLQKVLNNKNIDYVCPLFLSKPATILANKSLIIKNFSHIASSEPYYLKPVYFRK